MKTSPEASYFDHLKAHQGTLEGWRFRVQKLELPEPGSELASDDALFRYHPLSETARLCLASAGEHLRLAWTSIQAGELYPIAHFTTLRGALLSASQAVYILGPEEAAVRQARGLAVVVESYKRLRQFHREHLKSNLLSLDEKRRVSEQISWIAGRIESALDVGADRAGINVSDNVIPYAAKFTYPRHTDLQHSVNLLWRQMSGDAHALPWAVNLRATFDTPKDRELLTPGAALGSLEMISQPFEASFRILSRGWSLFDQRCEA